MSEIVSKPIANRVFQFLRTWDGRVWHIGQSGGWHHAEPGSSLCKAELAFIRDEADAIPAGGKLCGHCRRAFEKLSGTKIAPA